MHFIFGGAYQGKTAYVIKNFEILESDIAVCTADAAPDFSKPCVSHLERFARYCVRNKKSAPQELEACRTLWEDKIFISTDLSCGVVPVDAEVRAWREEAGRMQCYLASHAQSVTRMFCSLPQVLK